jgi:CRISPR-associated protein Csd2
MAVRKLIIFKHDSELGNAPAHKLFDTVHVTRTDESAPARCFSDYTVTVDEAAIPTGVTVECRE